MTFEGLVLVLMSILFFPFAFIAFRKTPIELSLKKKKLWPLWLYYEFILIILPILIVYFTKADNVTIFRMVKSGIEGEIGFLVLFTMYTFVITASVTLRYIFRKDMKAIDNIGTIANGLQTVIETKQINRFAFAMLFPTIVAYTYAVLFGGYKPALIYSLLYGEDLLQIRLYNSYYTQVPPHFKGLFFLSSWVFAIQAGVQASKKCYFKGTVFLLLSILLASAPGSKAPIIASLLNFLMALGITYGKPLNLRRFGKLFICVIALGIILSYSLVSLQFRYFTPDMAFTYIQNRLGIGQMAGVYETFSLDYIPKGAYYWSMIPLSSFFVDYADYQVDFHKVLMMITEGVGYTDLGVKNSLFIAEAYAIGGSWLLYLSPFIVGVSFSLGMWCTFKFLQKMFGNNVAITYFIPLYLSKHKLTGGFAAFPLLKGVIGDLLLITPCWFVYLLLQAAATTKKNKLPAEKTINHNYPFVKI